jgi:hypothetical protein
MNSAASRNVRQLSTKRLTPIRIHVRVRMRYILQSVTISVTCVLFAIAAEVSLLMW